MTRLGIVEFQRDRESREKPDRLHTVGNTMVVLET